MGRIRITVVKRTGRKLLQKQPDRFKKNFEDNKTAVTEIVSVPSKKLRNMIAGYITKLMKTGGRK